MRLATFNLLHGRSLTDGTVDPDRLRAAMATLDADVVGLQEVDRAQPRSRGLDLTAVAAEGLAGAARSAGTQVSHRFVPALIGTPGGRWRPATDVDGDGGDEPGYGVGLVTRLPVLAWHTVRLPAAPVRSPVLVPGTKIPILLKDEPRVALAAVVETPTGPLTVATTHLSFVPVWNGVQLRRLVAALRVLPAPQVLLGDLNLPGPLPGWLTGWRQLARTATYPVGDHKVQLDHVLVHGALPPVREVEVHDLMLSDHAALLVRLAAATKDEIVAQGSSDGPS